MKRMAQRPDSEAGMEAAEDAAVDEGFRLLLLLRGGDDAAGRGGTGRGQGPVPPEAGLARDVLTRCCRVIAAQPTEPRSDLVCNLRVLSRFLDGTRACVCTGVGWCSCVFVFAFALLSLPRVTCTHAHTGELDALLNPLGNAELCQQFSISLPPVSSQAAATTAASAEARNLALRPLLFSLSVLSLSLSLSLARARALSPSLSYVHMHMHRCCTLPCVATWRAECGMTMTRSASNMAPGTSALRSLPCCRCVHVCGADGALLWCVRCGYGAARVCG